MKSVNKVFLLGHVGMVEPRSLDDGTVVANFSVATNTRWKDKDGVTQESVEWHRCEAWNKLGELAGAAAQEGLGNPSGGSPANQEVERRHRN